MTGRKILTALVAVAATAALALGVAGTASPAAKRSHFIGTCAFGFGSPPLVITQCPDTWAEIGAPVVFDYSWSGGTPVEYNLDRFQLEGTLWWKTASHNQRFNGLAPGFHSMLMRATPPGGTEILLEYTWIQPGPAAENVVLTTSGVQNSRATLTWTSRIPAWRTYCLVNDSQVWVICRQTGFTMNGTPAGGNQVIIRSLSGPLDEGRYVTVVWDRADPQGSFAQLGDTPWGPLLMT